jgi:hypothetical protein
LLQGCTHLAIEDCGGTVLGENAPRIRSSHFRMFLADLPAASERFAPFAAMSTLAYAKDENCGSEDRKLSDEERRDFEKYLAERGWREHRDAAWAPPCEDDVGMFFRVWTRHGEVVLAFRGTWGVKDWVYGNLHWLTRFLPMEDQYDRARKAAQRVFEKFARDPSLPTRFYATGHSLGGGLAQHVLYSYPHKVVQALVFDPSSVTGFADQTPENQVAGCDCSLTELNGEPRILRVYDAYEVLAYLRIFHKTFFPPERHVQEVRFPNAASHSMKDLTSYFMRHARPAKDPAAPWYAGVGAREDGESCTTAFARYQRKSCKAKVSQDSWNRCPQ